jgi:rubrerythrin
MDNALIRQIRLGQATELKGIRFYTAAMHSVHDENSKRLLKFLIGEEKIHFKVFSDLLEQKKAKSMQNFVLMRQKVPLFGKKAYKTVSKRGAKAIDIFATALDMEKKGIELYKGMAARTGDKEIKKFLKKLARDEQTHYGLIMAHKDSLYNYMYWEGVEQPGIES